MTLDEQRVEWLQREDALTNTYDIRKIDVEEEVICGRRFSLQQVNWFRYLLGFPPVGRGETSWLRVEFTYSFMSECKVLFYQDKELKDEYQYLEDLYDIVREEK